MTEAFPAQPWHLRGAMFLALWPVGHRRLPDWPLPAGVRPVTAAGRRCLATFWVDYRPGGTLAYRELLVAMAVRDGRGLAACAVDAWVDDERSRDGGRALWGIPKRMGVFAFASPAGRARVHGFRMTVPDDGRGTEVTGTHRDVVRLPGRLRLCTRLLQPMPEAEGGRGVREVLLDLRGRTTRLGRAGISARPGAPLAYLTGCRPLVAASLDDFRFRIGSAGP
ncbi:acetoacetate decarboxylase family protein [Streptomyces luteireticuli]|uniref:Acetoacetate decarboxylase n=1 Tax=Streptomyces luteireticuli TaxID=173858 RepID=A0ABN0YG01_9ACTN